jgi:H/ACA ribonucleoprotein complex subunit 2
VGAKKAKEEDVKPNVKPVVAAGGDKEKAKKARKPKEPRELRHFPLSPIAHPLASAEQQAALFALLEKAAKAKQLRRGVKEIQKVHLWKCYCCCLHFPQALRKKEVGLMVLAGDVEPLDVISHLPVLCEDFSVPYIFVRSKG